MNCKHEQIQTWRTDDGTPVMWSCVDCNHKFEPLVIRKPLTDEQWQQIAAITGCVRIEKRGRDAILRVLQEAAHAKGDA